MNMHQIPDTASAAPLNRSGAEPVGDGQPPVAPERARRDLHAGRRLAAGGGGFFRVLPYAFTRWAIRQVNLANRRPAVFYFHPWEIDPDQPRVSHAPLRSRLRHYTNLTGMAAKLGRLLREFRWGRIDQLVQQQAGTVLERAA